MLPAAVLTKVSPNTVRLLAVRCLELSSRYKQHIHYSQDRKASLNFVLHWNIQNKKLFGPVLKKKKTKKEKAFPKDPIVTADLPGFQLLDYYNPHEPTPAYEIGFPTKDNSEPGGTEIHSDRDTEVPKEIEKVVHEVIHNSTKQTSPRHNVYEESEKLGHVDSYADSDHKHSFDSLLMFPMVKNENKSFSFPVMSSNSSFIPPEIEKLSYYESYPSVTSILDKTRPPEAQFYLDRWKKEMIEKLGEEGFQLWQKETLGRGSNLHQCVQSHLEGKPGVEADLVEGNAGHWASLQTVLPDISEVKLMEERVAHPDLHYRGVFDCIASYRGQLCLIDWKTSKKPKPTLKDTFDNPLQLAAYIGAVNYDSRYDIKVDNAMVVIAYEDGSQANAHWMSREKCIHYWGQWLHRLAKYWTLKLEELQKTPKT